LSRQGGAHPELTREEPGAAPAADKRSVLELLDPVPEVASPAAGFRVDGARPVLEQGMRKRLAGLFFNVTLTVLALALTLAATEAVLHVLEPNEHNY
jgi:hypothetical protein